MSPSGQHHAASCSCSGPGGTSAALSPQLHHRVSRVRLRLEASRSPSRRTPGATTAVAKRRTDTRKILWALAAWPHAESRSTKERHLTRRCLQRSAKFLFGRSPICSRGDYQPFTLPLLLAPHKLMGRSQSARVPAGLIPPSRPSVSGMGSLLWLCLGGGDQESSTTADGLYQERGEF